MRSKIAVSSGLSDDRTGVVNVKTNRCSVAKIRACSLDMTDGLVVTDGLVRVRMDGWINGWRQLMNFNYHN